MSERPWAHVIAAGPHGLRRGSWFEVLDASASDHVVVDVAGTPRAVPRASVEIEARRPLAWTVVVTTEHMEYFGAMYAVCPNCVQRSALKPEDEQLACPSCGYEFPVDWSTAS